MKIITPANPAQLHTLTAAEAARLINERKVSSEALVRACLARIDAQDHLNAFITINAEQALAQAKAWDQHLAAGGAPLPLGAIRRRGSPPSPTPGIPRARWPATSRISPCSTA